MNLISLTGIEKKMIKTYLHRELEKRVERGSGARRQFSTPADNFSP